MSHSTIFVPPELVEIIVGFTSHRPTLQACSLVGRAFTLTAQKGLFREVVLSPPPSCSQKHTPAHHFLALLSSSPHLAPFVHSLIIECEDSVEGQPWLYNDNDLQHILPLLKNLSRISVNGRVQPEDERISGKANLSWTSLSSSLRSALASIIRSGSVIDLELGGFSRIPVSSVIDSFLRLKKLSLLPLYLVDDTPLPESEPEGSSIPPEHRVHLEDIKIKQTAISLRRTTEWLLSPTCHLDVRQLKQLHFEVSTLEDHRHISRIVDACADSLEHLELSPGIEVNSIRYLLRPAPVERTGIPNLSLASLKALKSLKVNTRVLMFKLNSNRFSDPLPWIVSLLSTLPEDNGLSELELSFALQLTQSVLEHVSWSDLSCALLSRKFGSLKRVTLSYAPSTKGHINDDRPLWVKDILTQNKHLSPLISRGLLHLHL